MIPIADHGSLIVALPFIAPPLLLVIWLVFLTVRDRRRGSEERHDAE